MKKIIVVSLGIILILTGCTTPAKTLKTVNDAVIKEDKTTTESEKSSVTLSTEASTDMTDESSMHVSMEYVGSSKLSNLTDFSEGKAFVQFEDYSEVSAADVREAVKAAEGSDRDRINYMMQHWDDDFQGYNRAALIDTQGRVMWKSEFTKEDRALKETSEFRNGLAYFVFNGNDKSTYNIIDSDGNVTFTRDFTEDFMILGHGDGLFLVAEHIVDFDTDEWQIGAMDRNGTMVAAYKAYEMDTAPVPPMVVAPPADHSLEMQDIEASLSQLEAEYQVWLEECWDYRGETDEEYYKKTNETAEDFNNRRMKLEERRQQLISEYEEQSEKYEGYQDELSMYEFTMDNYVPKTVSFDRYSSDPDFYRSCEYLGENIYKLNFGYGFVLVNIDMQDVINVCDYFANTEHIRQFITSFENGGATILYEVPVDQESAVEKGASAQLLPISLCSVCRIDVNGTITTMVDNIWAKYILCDILNDGNIFREGLLFVPYDPVEDMSICIDKEYYAMTRDENAAYENGFTVHTGVYCDIEGEVVIDFPEYRGRKEYICSPFYNGHAVVLVKGEDQLVYFTVIDREGTRMFELKSGYADVCMSRDGKYLTAIKEGMLTVFDVKGNPLMSIDYHNIKPTERLEYAVIGDYSYDETAYDVIDGMIRFNDFYVNIEEGAVLGSTFNAGKEFSVIRH